MTTFDKHDLALLRKCSERTYEVMKTASQEQRAFKLFQAGLLERQWDVYRSTINTVEYGWFYRLTPLGVRARQVAGPA